MTSTSAIASSLFMFLILTSSYRCDISDSGLASGNINVTFNNINKKISSTSSKSSSPSSSPVLTIDNTTNDVRAAAVNHSTSAAFKLSNADDVQDTQQQQQQHQIPLVRLPSNTLLKYTAYKDVSIQHFLVPMDTRSVLFSFKAYEESKSALSK